MDNLIVKGDYNELRLNALCDCTLSLKAKGLYCAIINYAENDFDDYYFSPYKLYGVNEKAASIRSALKELETHEYIKTYKLREKKTGMFVYGYKVE